MSEYLLEIALSKADTIVKTVSEKSFDKLREKVLKKWRIYEAKPVEVKSFGAVDGSNNRLDFKGLTLYAVIGYALTMINGNVYEHRVGDIDILYTAETGERITVLRELAETKSALFTHKPSLLMIDGSLRSLLIRPRPLTDIRMDKAVNDTINLLGENVFNDLWSEINAQVEKYTGEELVIDPFISKKLTRTHSIGGEDKLHVVSMLEYVEKLLSIRKLIEEYRGDNKHLAYISKTSRSSIYFREEAVELDIPLPNDIVLFTYFTREPGYSEPIAQPIEEVKRLPRETVLNELIREFYDKIEYIISYIRLVEDGPVLKVEIPVKKGVLNNYSGLIEELMNMFQPLSVNGYPYPLIRVDEGSKITRRDMVSVAEVLGLTPRYTGREVLGEWLMEA